MQPLIHALLFFMFVFSKADSNSTERAILLGLTQQWGNLSSLQLWNSTSSPCEWRYISCIRGSVTEMSLGAMGIQGSFPSTIICQLNNLTSISFNFNSLSGTIPGSVSSCSKLEILDLSNNFLTGKIPGELFSMKRLRTLNLGNNMLFGEIPTPLLAYYSLEYLDLSSNHLSGSIPKGVGNLYKLRHLDLSGNSFCGPIPEDIGKLYNVGHLDLSNNSFSGPIPEDIGKLYNVGHLDLSMNSFSGSIPARLLQLNKLSHLSLASNNLTGEIPEKLDLYRLNYIDLSHNNLSGTIPKGFGGLPQLNEMYVSNNQLSGDIWESVGHLQDSLHLRICFNGLSGRIPVNLVKERFNEDSCFDRTNLCSNVRTDERLPTCSPDWCFDSTTNREYIRCSSSKHSNIIIITCCVSAGALIVIIIFVFRRRGGESRKENGGEYEEEWSMIPFQRLEFSEREILAGLIDENLIGNGGSGKVYRVITRQGQRVAVKSIRHERRQQVHMLLEKQFLAEIQILGAIRHLNIVKLLCSITGNNTLLLVYEYMDKQCLYKWLHGKKKGSTNAENCDQVLDWERRLRIAIGAAQGLCYMHHGCNLPIVHRDIKSSNILLDSEFNAKIADFGLAKMLSSNGDNPETASALVGTFGYIAPEYGSTRKVNVKSDIYSFGVVLLELTTGREAVTRDECMNLAQWAHKHEREGNSVVDALDEEIKDPHYLEAATNVFKLGLACTFDSPSRRPSMKVILQILQQCSKLPEQ